MQRSNRAISISVRSLPTKSNIKSLNIVTEKFKVNSRGHYLVSTSFLYSMTTLVTALNEAVLNLSKPGD
jgi:hypothetical protein